MRVGMFGAGYVGIVTAAGLAELGHAVVLYDTDAAKLTVLRSGALPIFEPGLLELVQRGIASGALRIADDPAAAARDMDVVIVAVGTPTGAGGRTDTSHVRDAVATITAVCERTAIIVNKSTAPVGTADALAGVASGIAIAANPEFLREGSAVHDFFHPDRIVIGCTEPRAETAVRALYAALDAPVIVTTPRTAELIKYASNAFLALKVAFANEIAAIATASGVDVTDVLAGAGADPRVGTTYLQPGLGFGGSCLPKDLRELRNLAASGAVEPLLLDAAIAVNERQAERVVTGIGQVLGGLAGSRIGVLGLAFKPDTDDVRDSPAVALVRALLAHGASVCVHDPAALENARAVLGEGVAYAPAADCYAAAGGADALVIATEWSDYTNLDFTWLRATMRRCVLIDARNVYDPQRVTQAGFAYAGIGRSG